MPPEARGEATEAPRARCSAVPRGGALPTGGGPGLPDLAAHPVLLKGARGQAFLLGRSVHLELWPPFLRLAI